MKTIKLFAIALAMSFSGIVVGQDFYYGALTVPSGGYDINFEGLSSSIFANTNGLTLNGNTTISGSATISGNLTFNGVVNSFSKFTKNGIGFGTGTTAPSALLHVNMGTGSSTFKNLNMFALTTNGAMARSFFGNTLATHGYAWTYDPTTDNSLSFDEFDQGSIVNNFMKIKSKTSIDFNMPLNFKNAVGETIKLAASGAPASLTLDLGSLNAINNNSTGQYTTRLYSGSCDFISRELYQTSYKDPRITSISGGKITLTNPTKGLIEAYDGIVSSSLTTTTTTLKTQLKPEGIVVDAISATSTSSTINPSTTLGAGTLSLITKDGSFNVMSDGKVCINCADSKGYTLGVNGTIAAKQVDVIASIWPDYVFEKDYHLPSLQEVEQHIAQYKHLPGVPSELEVKASGINVAKMDAVLMQKIEENTLYIIDLQKQNESAKQDLTNVKNQLSELQQQNELLKQQNELLQKLLQSQK